MNEPEWRMQQTEEELNAEAEFGADEVIRIKSDLQRQRNQGVMPTITFHLYDTNK